MGNPSRSSNLLLRELAHNGTTLHTPLALALFRLYLLSCLSLHTLKLASTYFISSFHLSLVACCHIAFQVSVACACARAYSCVWLRDTRAHAQPCTRIYLHLHCTARPRGLRARASDSVSKASGSAGQASTGERQGSSLQYVSLAPVRE
jgi:hypothetical protein